MAEQTTKKKFKIAVLTSGGDSAGMNAAVRAVVKAGISKGCEMWVVREGYEGLVRGNAEAAPPTIPLESCTAGSVSRKVAELAFVKNIRFGDGELFKQGEGDAEDRPDKKTLKGRYIVKVGWDDVRGWMGEGGTLIGTARCAAFRQVEGRMTAAYNLIKEGIDALVVCGGDGSLTGADRLHRITKEQSELYGHLKIVGLVGSIDNDMAMTDLTIGAPTALHRICEAIDNINSTASSHSRAFVVEVMGRHCGWLALLAGVSAGADFIFIPENPPEAQPWEDDMCEIIQRHRKQGKRKTIVIIAEGAHDRELNPIRPEYVKEILTEKLGLDTRVTTLGHTQRGGAPCAIDRVLPTLQGVEAVNALLEATPETPSYMIGISENQITRKPLMEAVEQTQAVAKAISEKDFVKAMSLRDPEFKDYLEAFALTSALDASTKLPESKRLRVGIIHMGAPAGGMNAATRAAVRYCLDRGHTPLAINNGFPGLLDDSVTQLSWLRVDNWMTRGGSELGTNRALPNIDLGAVASKFQGHRFDALFMIGGFEAFSALLILEKGRENYPAFNIPMVHLPATISNNVPLTEFSLGSDTSLNALVEACDAIKQSAQANRNRVFVVETQGGQCGYLATLGALAVGAAVVYTPEVGINLDLLRTDVNFLKTRYSLDVKGKSEGRLVIMSEKASSVYTTDVLTKVLAEEGRGLFDSRSASLGHTLQGGIPSPIDRARAVRLSIKCMKFLEQHAQFHSRRSPPGSAAVITIQGTSIKLTPVHEMVQHADMKKRVGKNPWWAGIKQLTETLGGRTELLEASD
ncbi:6-phosphofructokinase, alpha subunit [Ceratobasidium sp. 423]|nr:6-phosphofructokinase, alpha subunit [Ceratobasidium sp. 423]